MAREKLQAARKQLGMTQQTMAERLNISLRHYQRIESGASCGTFEIWDMLEDLFNVPQRALREVSITTSSPKANQWTR